MGGGVVQIRECPFNMYASGRGRVPSMHTPCVRGGQSQCIHHAYGGGQSQCIHHAYGGGAEPMHTYADSRVMTFFIFINCVNNYPPTLPSSLIHKKRYPTRKIDIKISYGGGLRRNQYIKIYIRICTWGRGVRKLAFCAYVLSGCSLNKEITGLRNVILLKICLNLRLPFSR